MDITGTRLLTFETAKVNLQRCKRGTGRVSWGNSDMGESTIQKHRAFERSHPF